MHLKFMDQIIEIERKIILIFWSVAQMKLNYKCSNARIQNHRNS